MRVNDQKDTQDFQQSLMNILVLLYPEYDTSYVVSLKTNCFKVVTKQTLEQIEFEYFKNDYGKIIKNTDKIINNINKMRQAADIDLLSYYNLIYLLDTFNSAYTHKELFIKALEQLSHYEDLEANKELKKTASILGELEKIINKLNALNAEIIKIKGCAQKTIQEVMIKRSKRETETLNLEQFSEFKGKIKTKILFSIINHEYFRVIPKRKNSKGKLDTKFGTEQAALIRSETRHASTSLDPLNLLEKYSTGDFMDQFYALRSASRILIPPDHIIKKFDIKNIDQYQKLIKNKMLEILKKVFKNHPKFFYGYYGKYFNIDISLFLTRSLSLSDVVAYVLLEKNVLSNKTPTDPERDFKLVRFVDPRNIEIFISTECIVEILMGEPPDVIELILIHELTHLFTKHIKENDSFNKLFSEGIGVFSEYCIKPGDTLEEWICKPEHRRVLSELTKNSKSIETMESIVNDRAIPYYVGFYMWLTIYAYKRRKKGGGRKCFRKYFKSDINTARLIKIVDKEAIEWLRKFRSLMTPKLFFKQYAEATKKMKVPSIFNKAAMEFLIEDYNEDVAKRKRDIETRKIIRNLLKLARRLKQRDMEEAERNRNLLKLARRLKQRDMEEAERKRTS